METPIKGHLRPHEAYLDAKESTNFDIGEKNSCLGFLIVTKLREA